MIGPDLAKTIKNRQSCFLLGPRQVGKTTLIQDLLPKGPEILSIPLQDPSLRSAYERDPGLLVRQLSAAKTRKTVFIDEVQKVPELLDAVQLLIDEGKANFILTGSSARKLRKAGSNLLPGRVKSFHLDPLSWTESGWTDGHYIDAFAMPASGNRVDFSLEESMAFGSLPGIATLGDPEDRKDFLRAYANLYLEEEIRAEALTRKVGAFSRFLELAAQESGTSPNLSKLSMEAGVSVPTIKEYYAILQETLVLERVDPYLKNARKRILSSPRYYFFDMGVRNALARLPMDAAGVNAQKGILFEHAVVLEIIRRVRASRRDWRVRFWRTAGGAEVDCIVDMGDKVIPIEIKSAQRVRMSDLKGLSIFLKDHPKAAKAGYVITMGEAPERLAENVFAVPWHRF
ncbi:MAG TPA: ATP-binding protein [Fibrobacteria bacterium]|nr:ATP-binding protein [Fibrobacteria bacterium]